MHGRRAILFPAAVLTVLAALGARAEAVETGQVVGDVTLKQIDGGPAPVIDRASTATAVIFFRTQQERSDETLGVMASCQKGLAGKPVRWVGVVPGDTVPADARAAVAASGMKLPVLVDDGDALYSRLGIRMHPGVAIVDRAKKLVAYEPFHQVDYCGIVSARLRRVLGEISDADVAKAIAPAASRLPGEEGSGVAKRHLSFGRRLLGAKAYAQAHESARKAAALSPSAEAWTLEGDIFVAEGRCAEAVKAFEAALALDPGDSAAAAGKRGCAR